jgi:predicted extracellular nuclease
VGTDEIRVGIIYQPAVVVPVGQHAIIDSSVDPRFIDTKNRPSLAQTFDLVSSGARFTVVVNHLKSKGSACDDVGDPDIGDGQGNCNVTRTMAAEALVDWLTTDPTGSGDPDVLLIGDMNSYAMEDPIAAFRNAGYTDTIAAFVGDEAYTYVFQGQSGYLDHALATSTLNAQVNGVTQWHINADEPIALDYNVEFKTANHVTTLYAPDAYRSSDHDPVLVGLDLTGPPSKCTAKKLTLAGRKALVFAKCHAKAVKSGEAPDGECFLKASDRFTSGWAKAESKDDCLTLGDVATIEGEVDGFDGQTSADLPSTIQTGPGPSMCTAKKFTVAGKKAAARLKCHAKAVGKGLVADSDCLDRASTKFVSKWAKAEEDDDCQTTLDVGVVEQMIDEFVADIATALVP